MKERERKQEKKEGKKECEAVCQWSVLVDTPKSGNSSTYSIAAPLDPV